MDEEIIYDADTFILDKFEFENGKVIENAVVEYTTFGEPKYDSEGNITNAVVYCLDLQVIIILLRKYIH